MSGYNSGGVGGVGPKKFDEGITQVRNDIAGVKTDTEQIKTDTGEVKEGMEQLVANVQKQVEELRTIVENSPAGVMPPDLFSLSAQSTEEGIKLTYQASLVLYTDGAQENFDSSTPSDKKVALSRTKAVMFRYSDIETPTDITEGNLAFVDYDLFIKNDLGHNATKQKTNTIVGLTQNKTYYISAFPISTNNVYNLNAGANGVNRTKCRWTGTKGTLTVNVTQDYDYKPLGEYTATLTPTAGGQAITKTQSGAATVVFSWLEAGEYTLSFSAPQYFTAPQSQSVTVVAGQSQTVDKVFELSGSINDYSFDDLVQMCRDGMANKILQIGTEKENVSVKVQNGSSQLNFATDISPDMILGTTNVKLIGIDSTDNYDSSIKHTLTFVTVSPIFKNILMYGDDYSDYGDAININKWKESSDSYFRNYVNNNRNILFPDISEHFIQVKNKTGYSILKSNNVHETVDYVYPLSAHNVNIGVNTTDDSSEEEITFPYFTDGKSRRFLAGEDGATRSLLRTTYIPYSPNSTEQMYVNKTSDGGSSSGGWPVASANGKVCLAFTIG